MAEYPKIPRTALELLEPRERIIPFLNTIYGELLGSLFGFGLICVSNKMIRRPMFSGIQNHVMSTGICGVLGHYMYEWRMDYFAERDAVLRHYVSLHPEDFILPERKKVGELLEPWIPVR